MSEQQGGYGPPQGQGGQGGYGPPRGQGGQGGYGPPQGQGGQGGYGPPQGQGGYGPQGQGGYSPAPGYGSPPQASGGGDGQLAGVGKRFAARLIDQIGLTVVAFIIGLVFGGASLLSGGDVGFVASVLSTLVSLAVFLGYFVFLESSRGQTVGKMLLSIRTVAPGGGNPTAEQAFKRNAFYLVGLLGLVPVLALLTIPINIAILVALLVTVNSDPQDQGFHDKFAGGTTVVNA